MPDLALFDFDGTLTHCETFPRFVRSVVPAVDPHDRRAVDRRRKAGREVARATDRKKGTSTGKAAAALLIPVLLLLVLGTVLLLAMVAAGLVVDPR